MLTLAVPNVPPLHDAVLSSARHLSRVITIGVLVGGVAAVKLTLPYAAIRRRPGEPAASLPQGKALDVLPARVAVPLGIVCVSCAGANAAINRPAAEAERVVRMETLRLPGMLAMRAMPGTGRRPFGPRATAMAQAVPRWLAAAIRYLPGPHPRRRPHPAGRHSSLAQLPPQFLQFAVAGVDVERHRQEHARVVVALQAQQELHLRREQRWRVRPQRDRAVDQLERALRIAAVVEQQRHLVQHLGPVGRDAVRLVEQVERDVALAEAAARHRAVVERRPELRLQAREQLELDQALARLALPCRLVGGLGEALLEVADVDAQHRAHAVVARLERQLAAAERLLEFESRRDVLPARRQAQSEVDLAVAGQHRAQI